jgi:hypothetical protein
VHVSSSIMVTNLRFRRYPPDGVPARWAKFSFHSI